MEIDRMNNMIRDTAFAVILVVYLTFVPFLLRTAMLCSLGVEYLGLNGLFASIIQVLNICVAVMAFWYETARCLPRQDFSKKSES